MDIKKKNRGGGGKKSGRGGFQQQQDCDQSRPNYPPAESDNAGRGAPSHHQYNPRAGGSAGPSFHDPGSGRFRAPPPMHQGEPPIHWGPLVPEISSETQASSSSKSGEKKTRKGGGGIADKPFEQALETALVLGCSSQTGTKKPESSKVEKAAPPAKPIQDPDKTTEPLFNIPKRPKSTLAHPPEYFHNEKGSLVEVNFLRIDLKYPTLEIFQYDVAFEPDIRPELFREAVRLLFEQYRINRHPAHDGRKQIYVAGSRIDFPGDTDSFTGNVEVPYEGGLINYRITVKLLREMDLQGLATYMRNGSSLRPFDVQPLEIALMHPAMSNTDLIKAGHAFFTVPNAPTYLGNGMDLFKGHTQSVIIPWWDESKGTPHLYLNVDVAHKGFPRAQPVINYISHQFFSNDERGPPLQNDTILASWQMQAASRFLKNIKVSYDDGVRIDTFKVDSLGPSARDARFTLENGRETTVLEYFRTQKNIELQYPNLPCLNFRNRLFPIERCSVVPMQVVNKVLDRDQTSMMVTSAAKPTYERKQTINQSVMGHSMPNRRIFARGVFDFFQNEVMSHLGSN